MSTNTLLTRCEQRAVRYSPRSTNTLQRPAFLCFRGFILNIQKAAPTFLIREDER